MKIRDYPIGKIRKRWIPKLIRPVENYQVSLPIPITVCYNSSKNVLNERVGVYISGEGTNFE